MLLNKLFIPKTRAYELILSRLASLNLIVRVDEWSIIYQWGHLISLVHDLKVTIPVYWRDFHLFVMHWDIRHVGFKIIDKLLWIDVYDTNFANVQCNAIALPDLVLHKTILLIMMHDRDFSLASNKLCRLIQENLLKLHAALIRTPFLLSHGDINWHTFALLQEWFSHSWFFRLNLSRLVRVLSRRQKVRLLRLYALLHNSYKNERLSAYIFIYFLSNFYLILFLRL